jgi:hypothetical protein
MGRVSYIDEHIDYSHRDQCSWGSTLERYHRISGFAQGVVSVAIPDIAPYNVVQGGYNAVVVVGQNVYLQQTK